MIDLRQLLDLGEGFSSARRCEVPGCGRATRERKPWCSEHILTHSPLAREVHQRVLDRERADACANAPIPEDMLDDAWTLLAERGCVSVPLLARMLDVSHRTAERVAKRLSAEGAAFGRTQRGKRTVSVA